MSEDYGAPDAGQWLTISEASKVLDISERQARRYAGRLQEHDRREPDTGPDATPDAKVLRVRLSAMASEREKATGQPIAPDVVKGTPDSTPGALQDGAGHKGTTPDSMPALQITQNAEFQQLRGEVDQLKAFIAGGALQTITERLAALPDAEQSAQMMAQAVEQGITAALQADAAKEAQRQAEAAQQAQEREQRLLDAVARLSGEVAELREAGQQKRGFFARLFGGG